MNGLRLANSDVEVKLLFERFDKNKDGELSWEEVK
jgi:Ca2+-binding EF-hand superfamily protein